MLYKNQGLPWVIDTYNALNVIDLNGVLGPHGIRKARVKIRRGDLNLLVLHRNQDISQGCG